jgi:hypothetical protein
MRPDGPPLQFLIIFHSEQISLIVKYITILIFSCAFFVLPPAFAQSFDIYVSDAGNFANPPWKILKYDENGDNPEAFITSNLAWPQDILFQQESNTVLISNLNSGLITRYNADTGAYIDNFASNIAGPTRMKIGPDNRLYVLQWNGNGRVLRYALDGTLLDEFSPVGVAQSIGLDWDSSGNLYVSSFNGASVRKYDPNGNDMGLFINANLSGPTNIWFDDNGDLLVSDYSGRAIKRFDSSGNFLSNFVSGLNNSEGVAFFPNGNFLIGNGGTSAVKLYDTNGNFIEDLISSQPGGLQTPNAVVLRQITSSDFPITSGLNDAWFNLDTGGQGFFIMVYPDQGTIFLAWFTFETELPDPSVMGNLGWEGQRWLTAFGPFTGDTATLDIEFTEGGVFNSATPAPVQTANGGTITIVFHDCESATLTYVIPGIERSGTMQLIRLSPDNVAACVELSGS